MTPAICRRLVILGSNLALCENTHLLNNVLSGYANTLRLWDLASRTIINTITIPNVGTSQMIHCPQTDLLARVVEFKMSSSSPIIQRPQLLPLPFTWVKCGSFTHSAQTQAGSRVSRNSFSTSATKRVTQLPFSLILAMMQGLHTVSSLLVERLKGEAAPKAFELTFARHLHHGQPHCRPRYL